MRDHLERDELRYAVWLEPDAVTCERVIPIMQDLRQRCGGPTFVPHLTLCSGIHGNETAIIDQLHAIATAQAPCSMTITGLRVSGNYFRAITLETTLPDDLRRFHEQCRQRFALDPGRDFHPHLSLVYGDIDDLALNDIKGELHACQWPTIHIQRCALWRLRGPVENWQQVASLGLTG